MKKIIKFECHYHSAPVLIGEKFDTANLHAEAYYEDGEIRDIFSDEYTILEEDWTITEINNVFTASYMGFIDKFHVKGYTADGSVREFKIFSIEGKKEVDVTDAYEFLFYNPVLEKPYVTLATMNRILTAGKYRFILPMKTGMCGKYASEWIVIKDLNNSIRATPVKFYRDERE